MVTHIPERNIREGILEDSALPQNESHLSIGGLPKMG
jgi:hypothetical protein